MINAEKQFKDLRTGLDQADTSLIHTRIERVLRDHWDASQQTQTSPRKWTWKMFTYVASASGIAALALITVTVLEPLPTQTVSTQTRKQDPVPLSLGTTGSSGALGYLSDSIDVEELPITISDKDFTYKNEGETAQLLNESVILSLDVQGDILNIIHTLRDQVSVQDGYLLNISYYDTYGTLDIKLPADQLITFEKTLQELDINNKVEVSNYVVENLSQQVVAIDEIIQNTQEQIDADKAQLTNENITQTERRILQEQIIDNEEYLKTVQTSRQEKIAEYDLISVRVILNKYSPFWEGNYTQYDRSTLSGMIKYELSKAVYTLIRSGSKILRFVIWLAVYSVILVPVFFILKKGIRKIYFMVKAKR